MEAAGASEDEMRAARDEHHAQQAERRRRRPPTSGQPPGRIPAPECCPHLGGATDKTATIYGCGCAATRANGIPVTVFECDRHGECVTYQRGELRDTEATIKRCIGCQDHPARRPATA